MGNYGDKFVRLILLMLIGKPQQANLLLNKLSKLSKIRMRTMKAIQARRRERRSLSQTQITIAIPIVVRVKIRWMSASISQRMVGTLWVRCGYV